MVEFLLHNSMLGRCVLSHLKFQKEEVNKTGFESIQINNYTLVQNDHQMLPKCDTNLTK